MSNKYDIKINDALIISPVDFIPSYADLVTNSGRNAAGDAKFNYVATKVNWEAVWGVISETDVVTLLGMIEGASNSFFSITAKFPGIIGTETRTYYKGDRKFGKSIFINGEVYYKSLSIAFIQK